MSRVVSGTLEMNLSSPILWQLTYSPEREQPARTVDIDSVRFRVGRRDGAELILRSPQLSGLHAEFVMVGMRLFIRDLASTNGTYVNGKRVGYRDTPLRDGDHIRMANVEFTVHRRHSGIAPPSESELESESESVRHEPGSKTTVMEFPQIALDSLFTGNPFA